VVGVRVQVHRNAESTRTYLPTGIGYELTRSVRECFKTVKCEGRVNSRIGHGGQEG